MSLVPARKNFSLLFKALNIDFKLKISILRYFYQNSKFFSPTSLYLIAHEFFIPS